MVKLDNSRLSACSRSHRQRQQFLESFSISVSAHLIKLRRQNLRYICAVPTQAGCELHAGDERIWGNLGSLESRNENLGTVIRGVRQIRHTASPQYIWRANMEHLGPSSLVQEIRHIYALMCKIHQVSLARSDLKGQTGTVVAHLISATSTQIGTPGIYTGPIRSIV